MKTEIISSITNGKKEIDFSKFEEGSELIFAGFVKGNKINVDEVIDVTRNINYIEAAEKVRRELSMDKAKDNIFLGLVVGGFITVTGVIIYRHKKKNKKNEEVA